MKWQVTYCNDKLVTWVDNMPVWMRAYYAKITERMLICGANLGMPFTRALTGGLFELRIKAKEGICRIFYCVIKNKQIVMLHGFIKKSQKTPRKELAIAKQRMQEVKRDE